MTSGRTYNIKYRAENIFGWGTFSPIGTITASTLPGVPGTPTTANSGTDVIIDWTAPSSTGGTGISLTAYIISIKGSDGATYYQDTVDCDGTSNTIITNTICTIPMSTLTSAPF